MPYRHTLQFARRGWVTDRQALRGLMPSVVLVLLIAAGLAVDAQEQMAAASDDSPGFKLIVHGNNPTTGLKAVYIAKLFRKKLKRWDHGVLVVPVDLERDSPVREAFTRAVHKKSVTAIMSYWHRMLFSGRDHPPQEKATEDEVLAFVGADPGAIGYVSAGRKLADGVKELQVTP